MSSRLNDLDLGGGRSAQPKYERLKSHFVEEIMAGRLKPGDALPSQRHLVDTLGVAEMTIRQAMSELENDGLIRRVPRRGNFVETDAQQKLNCGLDIFALMVPRSREGFYPSLLHGFDSATAKIYHQAIICGTDDKVEKQGDIVLQLIDKKIGGIAMVPTSSQTTPPHQIRQLQERGIPVVFCHRGVEGVSAPLLAIPYREVGRMAGKLVCEHGHRHLACVTFAFKAKQTLAYLEGFKKVVPTDASVEIAFVEERPSDKLREESCWKALQKLFAMPEPPTCIFATFDSLAQTIYFLLQRMGLRVPEDVSLVGFGGAWRDDAFTQQLTSVVIDEVDTGRQAVSLLNEMRRGERDIDNDEEIVLPLDVHQGETLAAPPTRKHGNYDHNNYDIKRGGITTGI